MINSKIAGVGYYVPEKVVTNDDLASYLDTSDEWITRKIGIKERRVAADNEVTSDMGAAAAEMALKNAENAEVSEKETDKPEKAEKASKDSGKNKKNGGKN